MKHIFEILKDPRITIPIGFLLGFELFLQTGLYTRLMQPRSYADNVSRIIRLTGSGRDPNVLILGTSVAYQGIQMPLLNNLLAKDGLVIESGACEGAKLETQHLIMRELLGRMPNVKTIVHVVEASHPGTARHHQDLANRSMAAQFGRLETLDVLRRHRLRVEPTDYTYFFVRSLTYQKDLRDFVLDPLDRLKGIGRRKKEEIPGQLYQNNYTYRLSAYPAKNVQQCIESAMAADIEKMGRDVTDKHHRNAVRLTCQIVLWDPLSGPGSEQWTHLFFDRLGVVYKEIADRGIKIVVVFSPYSDILQDLNAEYRMLAWKDGLARTAPAGAYTTVDLRKSLDGPNNADLYYDTIHLNRYGADKFTEEFARSVGPILKENAKAR